MGSIKGVGPCVGVSLGRWVKRENDEEDWRRVSLEASPDVSCFSLAPSTSPQMIELHRISTISLNVRMISFMFNAVQLKHGIGRALTIYTCQSDPLGLIP